MQYRYRQQLSSTGAGRRNNMEKLLLLLICCNFASSFNICSPISEPECSPDINSFHPHQDCSLYYACNNGNLETYECNYDEHFSTKYDLCLPKEVANCNRRCLYYQDKLTRLIGWLFGETYAECPPTPTCGFFDLGVSKPYPPDCTKYIYCNTAGAGVITDCPEGLQFSATQSKCVDPAVANCKNCGEEDPTTLEPTEPTTLEPTEPTTETTTTTPEPTPSTTTTLPPCAPVPTCSFSEWGALKPYPPDCGKYVYCDLNGLAEIRICLTGLHFSESAASCTDPAIANCPLCLSEF